MWLEKYFSRGDYGYTPALAIFHRRSPRSRRGTHLRPSRPPSSMSKSAIAPLHLGIIASLLSLIVTGCSTTAPLPVVPCAQSVTVSATSGSSPRITWSPSCGVATLQVYSPPSMAAPYTVWWEITAPASTIASPVDYGNAPGNATTTTPSRSLPPGQSAFVILLDAQGHAVGGAQLAP